MFKKIYILMKKVATNRPLIFPDNQWHDYLLVYNWHKPRERKKLTCEAHVGTRIQTSNTLDPQATEADLRGSYEGNLFCSWLGIAWTSWLFSVSSFLIWFSKSWGNTEDKKSIQ
jgi:hypothetical protein